MNNNLKKKQKLHLWIFSFSKDIMDKFNPIWQHKTNVKNVSVKTQNYDEKIA